MKFHLYPYEIDDIVVMKKAHPCGSNEWKVLRASAEVTLQCLGCDNIQRMKRKKLESSTKAIKK